MNNIKLLSAVLIVLLFSSIILVFIVNTPLVVKSYSTGECLEVLSIKGEYSCDNMPKRYINEWAK